MKKTLLAVSLGLLMAQPAQAQQEQKNDQAKAAIGMGSGAVIGTALGGPVGGLVGALLGTFMGNSIEQSEQLNMARAELNATQNELFAMHDELEAMQQQVRLTRVTYEQQPEEKVLAVQSSIQFKTASVEVEDAYHEQLTLIANALKRHPQLNVRLTGHADNRGDETFNQALSMQRALNVKRYLKEQGVKESQMITVALGESKSHGSSYEETFFDRKVVLEIADKGEVLTAKR